MKTNLTLFLSLCAAVASAPFNPATAQTNCKYVTTQTDPFTHETSNITRHPIGPLMGGWTIVLRQLGSKWFVGVGMQNGKNTTDKLPKGSSIQFMFENGESTEILTTKEYESTPLPLNGQQYTQWMALEEVPKATFVRFGQSPITALKTTFQFKGNKQEFLLNGIKPKQSERTMETAACMVGSN